MRELLVILVLAIFAIFAVGDLASAQPSTLPPRIGLLSLHNPVQEAAAKIGVTAFRDGLRALGHVEGRTVSMVIRHAEGDPVRLQADANALVADKVDLIVAFGTEATRAARKATSTIPIVMAAVGDPIAAGFVASLSRPSGNVTGTALLAPDLYDKQLELLKEAAPRVHIVGILCKRRHEHSLAELEKIAPGLGVSIRRFCLQTPDQLPEALEAMRAAGVDSYISLPDPMLDDLHEAIAEFGSRHALPGVAHQLFFVEAGTLLSYGASLSELQSRAAVYADKILKGANPADLPVEQAERFRLAVNLKTARALGVNLPPSLLARADEVIE